MPETPPSPQDVDDVVLAFPANVSHLMPPWDEIPDEFRRDWQDGKWQNFVGDWFYRGLQNPQFYPTRGIDAEKAYRHVSAILRSFEPKHEHKIAACAYLCSLWFEKVEERPPADDAKSVSS